MATFLEICNQVNGIVGLQGSIVSVTSAKGIQKIIVEAVRSSWIDIQILRKDWPWMIGEVTSFNTTADQYNYTPTEIFGSSTAAADLAVWKIKRGVFLDNWPINYVQYEDVPRINNTFSREPRWWSFNSYNNNLIIELPDDAYNLVLRYQRVPQVLTTDAQVPYLNVSWQNAIAFKAVAKVAIYIGNAGLYQEYSKEANTIIGELMRQYIPERYVYPRSFI